MRKFLLSMLAATVLLGFVHQAVAQQLKPVAVVSLAGYNDLMTDVDALARLRGDPGSIKAIEMMLQMVTGGKGLAGLDKTRPAGGVFLADKKGKTVFCAFLPVTDLDQLAEAFASFQNIEINKRGAVYEISGLPRTRTLYAKQIKKWAILSDAKEHLKLVPADPDKLLGDMPKRYNLAVKLSVKDLPQVYREQLLAQLHAGLMLHDISLGIGCETIDLLTFMSKYGIRNIHQMLQEMDEVVLGWDVDPSNKSTYVDLELTAKRGTRLAKRLGMIKPGKSNFAGFFTPEAAVAANFVGEVSASDAARWQAELADLQKRMVKGLEDEGLSADELKLAESILRDVVKVLNETIKSKNIDGGVALLLEPNSFTWIAGGKVANGKLLDKVIEKWLDDLKETDPEIAKLVKLNAETYEGVAFHKLSMPVADPELKSLVGENMEFVVGIAEDRVYFAAGRNPIEKLKAAMDKSKAAADEEVPPLRMSISAKTIAKFAAPAAGNDPDAQTWAVLAALALPALADVGDKDHVLLTTTPIERGVRVRLEVEQGLLKAIMKTMIRSVMVGRPPGDVVPPQ